MPWAQLDDQFHSHPKMVAAGWAARGLYAAALSYCASYATDGFIPGSWVKSVGATKIAKALVDVSAIVPAKRGQRFTLTANDDTTETLVAAEDGYLIPDFLAYNPSRRQLEAKRADLSKRGRRGAQKRWQTDSHGHSGSDSHGHSGGHGGGHGGGHAEGMADATLPARAAPPPTPKRSSSSSSTSTEDRAAAALRDRLKTLRWTKAQIAEALTDPDRATAWADKAERCATTNPGGYAYVGFIDGDWPSPNGQGPTDPLALFLANIDSWVVCPEATAYREDEVIEELGRRANRARVSIPEDEITRLIDLWADAQRAATTP